MDFVHSAYPQKFLYFSYITTVRLVIFVTLIFHGLESSENLVDLYFRGVPTLMTLLYSQFFVDKQSA